MAVEASSGSRGGARAAPPAASAYEQLESSSSNPPPPVGAGLSEYELQRLRNIEAMLARFGLSGGLGAAGAACGGRGR